MRILVSGGGGFLAGHLIKRLLFDEQHVTSFDIKYHNAWWQLNPHPLHFLFAGIDARSKSEYIKYEGIETVYHLAADMGGMGYIGNPEHDSEVMLNNAAIDLNVMTAARDAGVRRFIYASSACVYPESRQAELGASALREEEAWPADPDTVYGFEKLFGERVLDSLASPTFRPLAVRLHNVYGPYGSWTGGREKAPAAMARKVAECKINRTSEMEIWGDGRQERSYLYVEDCVEGLIRLAKPDETEPINLGSDKCISVKNLAREAMLAADIDQLDIKYIPGPQGVRSRNADITRLKSVLGWEPQVSIGQGIAKTYKWIEEQVRNAK